MGRPYNGFSDKQRDEAYNWAKSHGLLKRPESCCACGQTQGLLEPHSEDYSKPFGPHIGAFGLCFRCHMQIHCRFRRPNVWAAYCDAIADGWIFIPIFKRSVGNAMHLDLAVARRRPPPTELVLDTIQAGGATSPETPRRFDVPVVLNSRGRAQMARQSTMFR